MLENPSETVRQITRLHAETVEQWHHQEIDNPYEGLLRVICHQHQFNFLLWHEEDKARSPDASDETIAAVKRSIDRYNQARNDWIETIDQSLLDAISQQGFAPAPDARLNSETPGSAIDRLSIMALRIYHLREQLARTDAGQQHQQRVQAKLEICGTQHHDLSTSLAELFDDIRAGRKHLKLYRQMKMYNDPALNPYLYQRQPRKAG
jgi:hypothetical protein